ncbi:uncharacterized protein YALI1_C17423g [Yarrowia lipolytica]|uniref:Uncharacterized protein n=1 Tax=Yarrowia lipolytica TaxID=4952 RepID=A0A1D8NAU5_YARLL|nr:hypothetical protein YALI1_C17423g [Yarrowia lipolytica]
MTKRHALVFHYCRLISIHEDVLNREKLQDIKRGDYGRERSNFSLLLSSRVHKRLLDWQYDTSQSSAISMFAVGSRKHDMRRGTINAGL